VSIITLGQYLRPSAAHLPVSRYYHPEEFAELAEGWAGDGLRPRRGRAAGAQLLPRQEAGRGGGGLTVLPLLMVFAFAAAVAGALLFIPSLIAPRRMTPAKASPFECGKDPLGVTEGRFAIKFFHHRDLPSS
jgi:hypothetical protein